MSCIFPALGWQLRQAAKPTRIAGGLLLFDLCRKSNQLEFLE